MPRAKKRERFKDPEFEDTLALFNKLLDEKKLQRTIPSILEFEKDPMLKTRGSWTVTIAVETMAAIDWAVPRLKLKRGKVIDWLAQRLVQEHKLEVRENELREKLGKQPVGTVGHKRVNEDADAEDE